ncbi:MAG: hypothetical protein GXX96_24580 [Planctomycetaceae bacterium]|nr:hypothetical protein [Planctomycetaceae bacterium]
MEDSYKIDVTSLDAEHRRVLEDVIGSHLGRNQRLMIRVIDVDTTPPTASQNRAQSISDWTSVYEGLSDKEVEEIDREVKKRADLTRDLC